MSKSHVYAEQRQASHLGLQMALSPCVIFFSSDLESNVLSWKDFSRDGLRPTL